MTDLTEFKMNVAALKRVDPYIKDILETATHVALYTFNSDNNEWEKTDIEGALFVYSRNGEPFNSILIMNRLNTNNLVEPVTQGLDLQLQEPFLLYKNSKCQIYGIWFYDKDECIRIAAILKQLVKDSEENRKTSNNSKTKKLPCQKTSTTNNVDIFSMLSKAQENFNTNRGNNDKHNINAESSEAGANILSSIASASSLGGLFDGTSQSVVDFFAKAKVNTGQFNTSAVDHQQSPSGNVHVVSESKPLLLVHLMSRATAHTLEHIEKQQRSITPQPVKVPSILSPADAPPIVTNISKNNASISKVKKLNKSTAHIESSVSKIESTQPSQDVECNSYDVNKSKIGEMNDSTSSFLRIQSPMTTSMPTISKNNVSGQNIFENSGHTGHSISGMNFTKMDSVIEHNNITSKSNELIETRMMPLVDSLISTLPTSISSLGMDCKSINSEELVSTSHSSGIGSVTAPALIPPVMFSAPSPPGHVQSNRPLIEPLTRNQLLQAFNYLIKSDPEFMTKLHEAYVKSFNEILS
ncbi:hypothetical protein PV327_008778 [Microctonus hyperodae]|uniref:mRNA-decapping enzyme C-terminal domain-containing protein n=1 Tax=Microctonus hyperodae TaxID=165561 RepID=A0AA39FSF1_MICHY|nr:hypothetical protein PV327_008778 [Microctonus hyperodae]